MAIRYLWILVVLLLLLYPAPVVAADEMLPDLSTLEDAVAELEETLNGTISLEDTYHSILNGDFSFDLSAILTGLLSLLLGEMKTFSSLLAQLLLLGLLSAVLRVFSESFEGTAAKVGQWVVFLAFLLVAIKNFDLALDVGISAIGQAADFLYAVFPVLLSSFALTGGMVASSVV